jgi:hypothetical protein
LDTPPRAAATAALTAAWSRSLSPVRATSAEEEEGDEDEDEDEEEEDDDDDEDDEEDNEEEDDEDEDEDEDLRRFAAGACAPLAPLLSSPASSPSSSLLSTWCPSSSTHTMSGLGIGSWPFLALPSAALEKYTAS